MSTEMELESRKLKLNKETILRLSAQDLAHVQGAGPDTIFVTTDCKKTKAEGGCA